MSEREGWKCPRAYPKHFHSFLIPHVGRQSERNLGKILPANIWQRSTRINATSTLTSVHDRRSKEPEESSCDSLTVDLAGNNRCSKLDISSFLWIINQLVFELVEQLTVDICEFILVGGIVMSHTWNIVEG